MRINDVSARASPAAQNPLKPLLVCFSHLRWSFVWQRPQQLLCRAARDYRILFVEEPLVGACREPHLDLSYGPGAVTIAVPVLPEEMDPAARKSACKGLIDELLNRIGSRVAVTWFYTPMALECVDHIESDVCVYDCMDELSAFRNAPPELQTYETRLFEKADIVFTGGRSLFEAKRRHHKNVHCFPSSIDAPHFRQARDCTAAEPADQAPIGRPRIGFFGVIDERMDMELLARMADLQPGWQFVMIGPVAKINPADLPRRRNIHWLGPKQYEDLTAYLGGWDIGFMPFASNAATQFISPTKTPEFLAAGLPVVSTPITDVVQTYGTPGYVEIAAGPEEMLAKAEMLLRRPRDRWLARVDRLLASMSWETTWRRMSEEIDLLCSSRSTLELNSAPLQVSSASEMSRV